MPDLAFRDTRVFARWLAWRRLNVPICRCGDYQDQHQGGVGPCRICRPDVPWENCHAFRERGGPTI